MVPFRTFCSSVTAAASIRITFAPASPSSVCTHPGLIPKLINPLNMQLHAHVFQRDLTEGHHSRIIRSTTLSLKIQITLPTMKEVLRIVNNNNDLYAARKKCEFGIRRIEFFVHIVTLDGLECDPQKVDAIKEWRLPKIIGELCGFRGLGVY